MKRTRSAVVSVALAGLCLALWRGGRTESRPAVENRAQAAFLIEFGLDAKEDIDWSGSISCGACRIKSWQFDSRDELAGDLWKCSTRRELYWDTPYEGKMKHTSSRWKVTRKGILVGAPATEGNDIRVSTREGNFSFSPNLAIGEAPRLFLDGRVSVAAVPASQALRFGVSRGTPEDADYPSLAETRDGALWLAYQVWDGNADEVFVRWLVHGVWSGPEKVTDSPGDYFRTAIAQDRAAVFFLAP